jgi:hypothetical protein
LQEYRAEIFRLRDLKTCQKTGDEWNSTFFSFSLIIEGTTEKVLQFKMPLKQIHNKTLT